MSAFRFLGVLAFLAVFLITVGFKVQIGRPVDLTTQARALAAPRPAWADRTLAQAQLQGVKNWRP